MTSNITGSFWHALLHDWPLAARIAFVATMTIAAFAATFLVLSLVMQGSRDIEFGLKGIKSTRSETTLERNCRMAREGGNAWNQSISNEILALESQKATKDHDLSETRSKCLAAVANIAHSPNESRCHTEISRSNRMGFFFAHPKNDHETVLNSIAEEKYEIELKIVAKEQERRQLQQQFNQRCLGAEDHAS